MTSYLKAGISPLAIALALVFGDQSLAQEASGQAPPASDGEDIVVTADRAIIAALRGIAPEREYDEADVARFGTSTVGEVIDEIRAENGDDEVIFLINGEPVSGIDDVADFPAEAVERLELLPRGSGQRIGREPDRRIYNVVLKKQLRSLTLTTSREAATEGDWGQTGGEAIASYIAGRDRFNLTLRARNSDGLTEADRGIIQPEPSAATRPAEFYETVDAGAFRTLRAPARSYEASLIGGRPIFPWASSSYSFVGRINRGRSLSGLPFDVFLLPASSPFSNSGTDQRLVLFGSGPLLNRWETRSLNGNMTLNAARGSWIAGMTGQFAFNNQRYENERLDRPLSPRPLPVPDGRNPFVDPLEDFFSTRLDVAETDQRSWLVRLNVGGPLLRFPAGDVRMRAAAQRNGDSSHSTSDQAFAATERRFSRTVTGLDAGLDIPLAGPDFLSPLGRLMLSLDAGYDAIDRLPNLADRSMTLLWQPSPQLSVSALASRAEELPFIEAIAGPAIIYRNVRVFDFLSGDTVDANVIAGSNPALRPPSKRVRRISVNAAPLPRYNLQLNFDYEAIQVRDFVSAVPAASTPVFLAFPDRFQRDATGRLVTIDTRPVNFDRQSSEQIRYGLSFFLPLGSAHRPVGDGTAAVESFQPVPTGTRPKLQLSASHTIALEDSIVIRPGLPVVDLLDGGAIGLGGGRAKHVITGSFAFTTVNRGLRFTQLYRGASTLLAGSITGPETLRFEPIFTTNVRAFADLEPILPQITWLKGTRLSFAIENLGNQRQQVTDSFGLTPLRYQAAYRDPIGRTVEIELRKKF